MDNKNYDQLIDSHKNSLINSLVLQYGEEYRQLITEKFAKIVFCFYENPRKLNKYIAKKTTNLGVKYTLEFFQKMGIDTKKIEIAKNGNLYSSDPGVAKFIEAFFPGSGHMNYANFDEGIFSFSSANSEENDYNLFKKAIVFKKLNYINEIKDVKQFASEKRYTDASKILEELSKIAAVYRDKLKQEFDSLLKMTSDLKSKELEISKKYLREYVLSCQASISEQDRKLLTENPNVSLDMLRDFPLLCENSLKDSQSLFSDGENYPLEPGLLEYFNQDNTDILINSKDNKLKAKIIAKRLEYFYHNGITKDNLGVPLESLFNRDWYKVAELRDKLPNINLVNQVTAKRKNYQNRCLNEIAKNYVLNGYEYRDLDFSDQELKEAMFFDNSEGVAPTIYNQDQVLLFISPMDSDYEVADIKLDHAIRHGIEYTNNPVDLLWTSEGINLGSTIEQIKDGIVINSRRDGKDIKKNNTHINEILNRKLAILSTTDRYQNGIFILSDPDDFRLTDTSKYDPLIYNFDMVFPDDVQRQMIKDKIDPSFNLSIYNFLDQSTLDSVDRIIMYDNPEIRESLARISGEILAMKNEKKAEGNPGLK